MNDTPMTAAAPSEEQVAVFGSMMTKIMSLNEDIQRANFNQICLMVLLLIQQNKLQKRTVLVPGEPAWSINGDLSVEVTAEFADTIIEIFGATGPESADKAPALVVFRNGDKLEFKIMPIGDYQRLMAANTTGAPQ